jgi:hypothetical protein
MNASKYLMVAAMLAAQNGEKEVKALELKSKASLAQAHKIYNQNKVFILSADEEQCCEM